MRLKCIGFDAMRCDVQNNSKRMHCYSEDESALTANCNNFWCGNSWVSFFNLSSVENVGCFIRSLQIFHIHTHTKYTCAKCESGEHITIFGTNQTASPMHTTSLLEQFFSAFFANDFVWHLTLASLFVSFIQFYFKFIFSLFDKRVVLFWKYIFIFL